MRGKIKVRGGIQQYLVKRREGEVGGTRKKEWLAAN